MYICFELAINSLTVKIYRHSEFNFSLNKFIYYTFCIQSVSQNLLKYNY